MSTTKDIGLYFVLPVLKGKWTTFSDRDYCKQIFKFALVNPNQAARKMNASFQTAKEADEKVWILALLYWEVLCDSALWSPPGDCLFTALRSCRLRTGMTKRWLTPLIGSAHFHPNGSKLGSVESGSVTQTHPQRWNVTNSGERVSAEERKPVTCPLTRLLLKRTKREESHLF